ncbi:hypothetical protein Ancab_025563 [Ancistrocladus abbreviatus]
MYSQEIDDDSNNELRISQEVFYGNDSATNGKRCAVSGNANFKCGPSKLSGMLQCSDSENYALTSQVSLKNSCLKGADNVSDLSQKSSPACPTEGLTLVESNDQIVTSKRMRLSVNELSKFKPYLEEALTSSVPLKDIVSGVLHPASQSISQVLMCHVVESSGEGVISSCYLLKQGIETGKQQHLRDTDVPKCSLSATGGSERNEIGGTEAIASPDSQESFTAKILAASPFVTIVNESGALRYADKSSSRGFSVEFADHDSLLKSDCKKDPRLLLRHAVFQLLRQSGWSIERRKRRSRAYPEFVYRSPEGRPIREFIKAWNLCGQKLFTHGSHLMHIEEKKLWNDIDQFLSDLSKTLRYIENEMKDWELMAAIAHKWTLLDPFVNVVFVERKIHTLRSGNVVEAKSSVIGSECKFAASFSLKCMENKGARSTERQAMENFYYSSLPTKSAGGIPFDGQFCRRTGEIPKSRSIYVSEGNSMRLVETLSGSQGEVICAGETSRQYSSASHACHSDMCLQSASCLYDVPIKIGNLDFTHGKSETSSPHQDSCCVSSPSCNKPNLEPGKDMAKEVGACSFEEGAEPLESRVTNEGNQLQGPVDDHLNCSDELLQSYELNKTFFHFNSVDSSTKFSKPSQVDNWCSMVKESGNLDSDVHRQEKMSLEPVMFEVDQQSAEVELKGDQCFKSLKFGKNATYLAANIDSKKKMDKKSKKISEIEPTTSTLCEDERYVSQVDTGKMKGHRRQAKLTEALEPLAAHAQSGQSCNKLYSSQCQSGRRSRIGKFDLDGGHGSDCLKELNFVNTPNEAPCGMHTGKHRSIACQLKDDDLLISAIVQKKTIRSSVRKCGAKARLCNSKARKSQKGGCRLLLRNLGKVGKHFQGRQWSLMGGRTVLSWLINSGVIFVNEVIQYRDSKGDVVVKDGLITRDGILCKCCNKVLCLSEFKIHAGFQSNRLCSNLFMESGKAFTLCQLQAWSSEYKARKSSVRTVQADEFDQNDDSCGLCGDGGELLCCDNCPSTFHQSCLLAEKLPEGSWYCSNCTCRICGDLVNEKEASSFCDAFKCSQCEQKYHDVCLKGQGLEGVGFNLWFCSGGCEEVYSGLHSLIGLSNDIADGFSWTLLRCIHEDQKVHSAQWFSLKAECNSKLAVALTIMEECFLSMVDPRTGVDMIPHVVYNWGSNFARLDYHGFYTVVLEKDDVLISVASIRVHGVKVAEMPLIATCSKYRRQGMCRRLLRYVEKMLISFKVEKLVIAAIPSLVETWTVGFGFIPMGEDEKRSLNKTNLMVFPGTVMLKKTLYRNEVTDLLIRSTTLESVKEEAASGQDLIKETLSENNDIAYATEAVSGVESNLCCPVSQKNGKGIGEHRNCSDMQVDINRKTGMGTDCMNLQLGGDGQTLESGDSMPLQISGEGGVSETSTQSDVEVIFDQETCLQDGESRETSGVVQYVGLQNEDDSMIEAGMDLVIKSINSIQPQHHHEDRDNSLQNHFVELSSEAFSKQLLVGSETTTSTSVDVEKLEDQTIMEVPAAVEKAKLGNFPDGQEHDQESINGEGMVTGNVLLTCWDLHSDEAKEMLVDDSSLAMAKQKAVAGVEPESEPVHNERSGVSLQKQSSRICNDELILKTGDTQLEAVSEVETQCVGNKEKQLSLIKQSQKAPDSPYS